MSKLSPAVITLLYSLDVLLKEKNVSTAARHLGVAQSTLSSQLSRLRELFGDDLLIPSEQGRGMVLTARGAELEPQLTSALEVLYATVTKPSVYDPAHGLRKFVIAINDNALALVGNIVIGSILEKYPKSVQISLVAPEPQQLVHQMERDKVDLYVGAAAIIPPQLRQRPLFSDLFCVVRRKGHPLGSRVLTLAEYAAMPHIMVSPAGDLVSQVDHALAAVGSKRQVSLGVHGYNQLIAMLRASDAIATVPRKLALSWGDGFELSEPPLKLKPFTSGMAWHPRSHADPAHQWLRARFTEIDMTA